MRLRVPVVVSPMRKLAPYVALALIVPGGSLIALSLWALRRPVRRAMHPTSGAIPRTITRTALRVLVALTPLLAACASSGLYNMSDQWCARHSEATAAQCPRGQEPAGRSAGRD